MDDEHLDFRPHIRLLLKRWRLARDLVIIAVSITLIVALLLPSLSKPEYVAKARVMLNQSLAQVVFDRTITTVSQDSAIAQPANSKINSLVALVNNPQIAVAVADQLGGSMSAASLINMISAKAVGGTNMIEIVATATDPDTAVTVVNAWTTQYNQFANQIYSDRSFDYSIIEQQIVEAKGRYTEAQSDLDDFIRNSQANRLGQRLGAVGIELAYLTGSPTKDTASISSEFTSIPAELRLVRQVATWYQTKGNLQALNQNALALQSQIEGGGDPAALSSELTQIALKTQALGATGIPASLQIQWSGSPNPQRLSSDLRSLITVVEDQLAQLDRQIKDSLQALLPGNSGQGSSSEQLVRLLIDSLNTELNTLQGQLSSENARKSNLSQEVELTATTYKALVQKREELNASRAFTNREIQIVSTAMTASATPGAPTQMPQMVMVAALLATVIGILAAYIIEGLAPDMPTPTLAWMVQRARKAI